MDEYLDSYVYPLLEETRAELASALETVYKAPFAEVTYCKQSQHDQLLYTVKVDNWRNIRSDHGKEPYRTLPGDFVLLSHSKPERFSGECTFASVRNDWEDDTDDYSAFYGSDIKLKTGGSIEVDDVQCKSLYVIYLKNMTTNKRIWRALKMRRNLKMIEKILTKNDSVCCFARILYSTCGL